MYTKYKIVPFCPYHFVRTILSIPFCPYHFVRSPYKDACNIMLLSFTAGLQAADKRHLVHFNEIRMHPHYHPPTRKSVITTRDMITRQLAMYRIVWEIARYFVFIVLALMITNIRRDYNIFLLNYSYKLCLFDQKSYKQVHIS